MQYIGLGAIICYLIASMLPIIAIRKPSLEVKSWLLALGFAALCLHGLLLHQWIDVADGQNLTFFNILSFSIWLIGVLVWATVLVQPIESLMSLIFPLAAFSMVLVMLFPSQYIINTANSPRMLFHILLSLFSFCVLALAGLLAVLLSIQERLLRVKKIARFNVKLPSLQSTEGLLFQVVGFGFVLLTVVLATSIYFYHSLIWQHFMLLQKTVLVLLAWLVLLVLLAGRYFYGWRGRRAIHYTLVGVLLLLAAYFIGRFVLQILS